MSTENHTRFTESGNKKRPACTGRCASMRESGFYLAVALARSSALMAASFLTSARGSLRPLATLLP